jgi:hypothetical protein
LVINSFTGEQFEITDLTEATAKLAEIKAAVLTQEDYRFTVAKEVVNGNDTTWMNADLENDPEDYRYHVFNTFTGQHELFTSLSSAKARRLEIKEQFANDDAPIDLNSLERFIVVSPVHPENALPSIEVTLGVRVTIVNPVHPLNASPPIEVKLTGNVMDVRFVFPRNPFTDVVSAGTSYVVALFPGGNCTKLVP